MNTNQKNMNYLPNDIMSLILSIRTEEMKKDKQIKEQIKKNKGNYEIAVHDLNFIFKNKMCNMKWIMSDIAEYNIDYEKDMKATEYLGMWVNDRYDYELDTEDEDE